MTAHGEGYSRGAYRAGFCFSAAGWMTCGDEGDMRIPETERRELRDEAQKASGQTQKMGGIG